MVSRFNIVKIRVFLIVLCAIVCSANQPSYQVSLYVHLHPQATPIHLCNGAIVQSRLILTTATCVHYKFSPSNSPVISIAPSMITVTCGSSTALSQELALPVADIFVANNFNYTTGANDLALLRLNDILPLDKRNDIRWITLEDDEERDGPCLANFNVQNSPTIAPNYIQSEQLPILESESCRMESENLTERKNDICSLYYLPTGFDCNAVKILPNYNGDRGTGLVCGNKLIGLLSTILPKQNITDCTEKPIKAYYTAVVPHIPWIFNLITQEDLKMLNDGEYILSSPYGGATNAFVKPPTTEPENTPAYSRPVSFQTTESSAQHNTAATITTNGKLLSGIWGLIYLILHAISGRMQLSFMTCH